MFDAIVLAGGAASRLGGADKPALRIDGASLLDRVLDAVREAQHTIVVGPWRSTAREVHWRREEPPGGGPVAALAAGLGGVHAPTVLVLAADLPWIAPAVPALLAASQSSSADVAVLRDEDGRRNYLAAAWRVAALRHALTAIGDTSGAPVRALFATAEIMDVPDPQGWGRDCDTWDDLAAARHRAEDGGAAQGGAEHGRTGRAGPNKGVRHDESAGRVGGRARGRTRRGSRGG